MLRITRPSFAARSEECCVSVLSYVSGAIRVSKLLRILLILFIIFFNVNRSNAQKTWDGGAGTSNWGDANNWNPNGLPAGTDAVTLASGSLLSITVNVSNAVCQSLSIGATANTSVTLNFNSGSQVTVGGTVTLGNAGGTGRIGAINMTSGGTLICQGFALAIAGTSSTFTPGTGTVQLTATNTLPVTVVTSFHNLIVSSGTTTLGVALNSTATGTIDIRSGATLALGTLNYGATTPPAGVTMECGGSSASTISGSTGTLTLGGNVTVNDNGGGTTGATISARLASTAVRTFTVADDGTSATDFTSSGIYSGSGGGVIKAGSGKMVLSGANTYTGTTTVNAGTLAAGVATNAFGSASAVTLANVSGAILDITGFNNTIGSLTGGGATGGNITLGAATLTIGSDNTSPAAYGGVISGTGGLTKSGTGTLSLSGTNTYTGTTTISAGTLTASSTAALGPAGNALSMGGGTLNIAVSSSINAYNTTLTATSTISSNLASSGAGITHTLGTLSIGNVQLNLTVGGNVSSGTAGLTFGATTFSAATPIFNTASGSLLTLGALSGNFAFTKNGTGQLNLGSASSRSTGVTTINAGTVVLGSASAFGTTGTSLTMTGGTLDLAIGTSVNAYNTTINGVATIVSNLAASGAAITHTLGTLSIGLSDQLNLTAGGNVSSGTAGLTFGATTLSAATPVFDQASGTLLTIGALTGNFAFTKQGAGQMTLGSASSRSAGVTTISAGTMRLGSTSALGTTATTITMSGGILDLATATTINAYPTTITGNATISSNLASAGAGITHTLGTLSIGNFQLSLTVGSNVSSGTAGLTFGATTLSAATPVFDQASGTLLTIGALSGNFAFTKQGTGQMTLGSASSRSSGVTTISAGTMRLGSTSALGTTATSITMSGGTLDLATSTTVNAYPTTITGNATISSNRATAGAGVTHTLGTLSIGNFQLSLTAGNNVSSGTAGLTFGNTTISAATPIFDQASATLLTLGALSGNFAFSKQGSGQITLGTASARTSGTVTVDAGTMRLGNTSALGTVGVDIEVNGGTLDLATASSVNAYPVTVGGTATIASNLAASGAGITHTLGTLSIGAFTLTIQGGSNVTSGTAGLTFGAVTHTGAPTYTVTNPAGGGTTQLSVAAISNSTFLTTFNGNGSVIQTGVMGNGSGGLTYSGSGTITLSQVNTYTGPTTVSSGTLRLGAAGVVPDASALDVAGTFNLNGFSETVGSIAGSGSITSTATGVLTVTCGGDNTSTTFSGTLSNGSATSVALVKNGSGDLTLSNANTYTGGTTLNAGTLNINNAAALGTSGTFTIAGGSIDNTSGANITTNNYTLALNGDFIYEGTVPRDLNLGTGTVTMSANRQITVSAGTLTIGGTINNNTQNVTKAGSGTLSFGSQSVTLNNVTINAGTLTSTSGTLTLAGDFSNSGTFTHNSGTVSFNKAGAQNIGTATFNNLTGTTSGTKTATGNITVSGVFTLSGTSNFAMGSNTLTLNGTLGAMSTTNCFTANGSSSLSIGGSGALGSSLFFDQTTPGSTNRLSDLTYNRASQTITLGNALQVAGILTPAAGTLASGSTNLTLVSDASGTANVANGGCTSCSYITGSVRVQRYIPSVARRFRFMGTTVQSTTLADWQNEIYITGAGGASNGFDATSSNAPSIYWYDETMITGNLNTGWTAATNTSNSMVVGRGYRVFIRGDRSDAGRLTGTVNDQNAVTMDLVGTPNMGNITATVSLTNSGSGGTVYDANNDGWNLVTNPYPCGYNWNAHYDDSTTHANIQPVIWVLSGQSGGYVSYNAWANAGSLTSGIIPPGASFWVKANNSGVPSLTFKEQYKITTAPLGVFKTNTDESFSLRLQYDSITYDDATVKYVPGSSVNYDDFDIRKLAGTVTLSVYGSDNIHLDLSSRPANLNNDTIKLYVSGAAGNYKLIFNNSIHNSVADHVFLFDTYLSTVTDLKANPIYNFSITSVAASTGLNRFYIVITSSAAVPVKLLQFDARKTGNREVRINWSTAQEINSELFEVQRSVTGKDFTTIASLQAAGNSNNVINYSLMDDEPSTVNYYRLKQVDGDGTFDYSKVVCVKMDEASSIKLYPVPACETLTINHPFVLTRITITDMTGAVKFNYQGGPLITSIDVGKLNAGVYVIEYMDETGAVMREKFTKE